MANSDPTPTTSHRISLSNMAAILNFITTIVVVVHSLQENMIQRLHKLYKHSAAVKETEQVESDCCAVCLNQMSRGEKVRSLPLCNHRYHADCIGAWLKNHTTCPLCRNKITDHVPQNQHKQVMKPFKESMIGFIQRFSDLLVVLLYTILPSSITETFPLVH